MRVIKRYPNRKLYDTEARQYVTVAPHVVLIPGVAILLVVVGLNLLGDALRDAFDIRLQET